MTHGIRRVFTLTFESRWLCYWLAPLAYAVVIFYLSSLSYPEEVLPQGKTLFQIFGDRWLHLAEYALLAVLSYPAFRCATAQHTAQWTVLLVIVVASFYGVTDEVHQAFVPFREASWMDWAADTAGAIIGAASSRMIEVAA